MTPRIFAIPLLAVLLAACQPGDTNRPVPSVQQIGSDLKCSKEDHGYADPVGWGFCYPGDWKYNLRAQPSVDARGLQELDITFDITSVPTVNGSPLPSCPSPAPPPQNPPVCSTQAGLFAYMIISTFQRHGAPDLASFLIDDKFTGIAPSPSASPGSSPNASPSATVSPAPSATPITWGNAVEAVQLADGRLVALTKTQVVVLELHSGVGNLDLASAMSSRLNTWQFYY